MPHHAFPTLAAQAGAVLRVRKARLALAGLSVNVAGGDEVADEHGVQHQVDEMDEEAEQELDHGCGVEGGHLTHHLGYLVATVLGRVGTEKVGDPPS